VSDKVNLVSDKVNLVSDDHPVINPVGEKTHDDQPVINPVFGEKTHDKDHPVINPVSREKLHGNPGGKVKKVDLHFLQQRSQSQLKCIVRDVLYYLILHYVEGNQKNRIISDSDSDSKKWQKMAKKMAKKKILSRPRLTNFATASLQDAGGI
jgi:hypothetical protein